MSAPLSPADPRTSLAKPPRVTFGVETRAQVQVANQALSALLTLDSPDFDAFRILRTKLKTLGEERPLRSLGLVSAVPQEGTSGVAMGLALAIAQEQDRRVLLVETTLRAPALARRLGLAEEPGLGEWLASGGGGPVPLRRLEPWGLSFLSAGAGVPQSAVLLGSPPMAGLLASARQLFDFVLLDCPPLEVMADSAVLQDVLDGFLLVVRARHATRDAIRRSLSRLKPGAVLGVVFNDRTESRLRWLEHRRPRPTS
jgi:Mrp family chromosome partitioning ATPase